MSIVKEEEVVIVGAGIAGLATAVALKRVGVRALVLERSDELRATGAALTLFPNAWLALDVLGVSHKLTSIYHPLLRGYLFNVETRASQETSLIGLIRESVGLRPVHRKALLEALAEELPADSIRFSSKLSSIDTQLHQGSDIAIIHLEDGTSIKAKVLIGCDGIHSVVGRYLGLAKPVYSGRSAVRGLSVYPEGHGLQQDVYQFVGVGVRAGFATLNDKEIYWFITINSPPKKDMIDPKSIQKEVMDNYSYLPPTFLDVVRHSDLSEVTWAQLFYRQPHKILLQKFTKGNISVAGDAMHPMTPDLGQGGGCAIEDAVVLARNIGKALDRDKRVVSSEVGSVLENYVKERRWRVAGVVMGAYLAGAVQQGSSVLMRWFRDRIYYKYVHPKIYGLIHYDCGKLSDDDSSSSDDLDKCNKME